VLRFNNGIELLDESLIAAIQEGRIQTLCVTQAIEANGKLHRLEECLEAIIS